jgi:alpha-1,6-mannosyltransferase
MSGKNFLLLSRIATVILLLALLASAVAYWIAGFRLQSMPGRVGVFTFLTIFGVAFLFYALALVLIDRFHLTAHPSKMIVFIIAVAALFRFLILPAGISDGVTWEKIRNDLTGRRVVSDRFLLYDHDVWRYLWDGRQQSIGLNPYSHAPAELEPYNALLFEANPELGKRLFPSDTWRDIWENINYKEIASPYPPMLQAAFRLAHFFAPGSVLFWKLLLVVIDLGLCIAIAYLLRELNLPAHYLAAYAWNPLVIKEIAGSAHADVIPAIFIAMSLLSFVRGRTGWGGSWLALGILAKLTPVVLLPFVWRRMSWRDRGINMAVTALGLAYFADAGSHLLNGFSIYLREWVFNPGIFELFRWISLHIVSSVNPSIVARALCTTLYLGLLVFLLRQSESSSFDLVRKWLLALGGLLFFSSAVMPWYFVWLLPLAAICYRRAWLIYSALCLLSYWVYIRGDGIEEAWRLAVIHGGFCLSFILERRGHKKKRREKNHKDTKGTKTFSDLCVFVSLWFSPTTFRSRH